jgi:hypothetical protein
MVWMVRYGNDAVRVNDCRMSVQTEGLMPAIANISLLYDLGGLVARDSMQEHSPNINQTLSTPKELGRLHAPVALHHGPVDPLYT